MALYKPGTRGTIRSTADYSKQAACAKLYEAMKGLGTDEKQVIDVVVSHTVEERQQIKKKYKIQYGKDLEKELNGELSFSFAKLVAALLMDPNDFILESIHKSISSKSVKKARGGKLFKRLSSLFKEGLGGTEHMLIAMLCIKSNEELKVIKDAYKKKYGDDLEEKLASDGNNMPQDVISFILDMIGGEREPEGEVDPEQLSEDCQELSTCKTEEVLHQLLQARSFTHLRSLFDECMNVSGKTIEGIIDDFEGSITAELLQAYKAMISLLVDGEPAYYADRVNSALEGAGTDDETLIKVVVLRAEVDMQDIMKKYEEKYKIDMATDVAADTSGDYNKILMRILVILPPPESPGEESKVGMGSSQEITKDNETVEEQEPIQEEIVVPKKVSKKKAVPKTDDQVKDDSQVPTKKIEAAVEIEAKPQNTKLGKLSLNEGKAKTKDQPPPTADEETGNGEEEDVLDNETVEKEDVLDNETVEEETKPEKEDEGIPETTEPDQNEEEAQDEAVVVAVENEVEEEEDKQEEGITESMDDPIGDIIAAVTENDEVEGEPETEEEDIHKGHTETKPSSPASREL